PRGARRGRSGGGRECRGGGAGLRRRGVVSQGDSGTVKEEAVPAALADDVAAARERLVEVIAEANDELLERYLDGTELSVDELAAGVREGARAGKVLPILCRAGPQGIRVPPPP